MSSPHISSGIVERAKRECACSARVNHPTRERRDSAGREKNDTKMTPLHLAFLILCISCKTSYNVLSHFHWGLGQFVGGMRSVGIPGGSEKKRVSRF